MSTNYTSYAHLARKQRSSLLFQVWILCHLVNNKIHNGRSFHLKWMDAFFSFQIQNPHFYLNSINNMHMLGLCDVYFFTSHSLILFVKSIYQLYHEDICSSVRYNVRNLSPWFFPFTTEHVHEPSQRMNNLFFRGPSVEYKAGLHSGWPLNVSFLYKIHGLWKTFTYGFLSTEIS